MQFKVSESFSFCLHNQESCAVERLIKEGTVVMSSKPDRVVLIGVAGDSGCGKSTFLQRLTDLFGEDFMTVICLDDYHSLDRYQRKETGITALDPRANNFDLMYEQMKALKGGQTINKPIYNHETGLNRPAGTG